MATTAFYFHKIGTHFAVTAGEMRYTVTYPVHDHPGNDLARGLARRWPE